MAFMDVFNVIKSGYFRKKKKKKKKKKKIGKDWKNVGLPAHHFIITDPINFLMSEGLP